MSISCTLRIGDQTIRSTTADLDSLQAVALDGLRVSWGRASRLDQPRPSTMSVTLILPPDPSTVLDQISPGTPVTVTAESSTPPTRTTVIAPTGPHTSTTTSHHHLPPGPLQPAGHHPDAWDRLPRCSAGSTYHATITNLALPPATSLTLWAAYYDGPWAETRTMVKIGQIGDGTHTITWQPQIDHTGKWVGLALSTNPLGPTFAQHPSTWAATTSTWTALGTWSSKSVTLTRDGLTHNVATVFLGRISDAILSWNQTLERPTLAVTATDITSEWANMRLGLDVLPVQTAQDRINSILKAMGTNARAVIDPHPGAITLARRDIDSQSPISILQDIATSTGAILWPTAHTTLGAYIRFEDLNQRKALYQLRTTGGTAWIDTAATGGMHLPASAVLGALKIERDTTDLATIITVDWIEQTQGPDGKITDTTHTATATDPARLATHGHRRASIHTDLTSAAAAQSLATQTLARSSPGGWSIPAATWQPHITPTQDPTEVLRALDSTTRIGLPILITGAASWIPGAPNIPTYLDGGTYTYQRGIWSLDMNLTRAATPGDSIPWNRLPPALDWLHMGTVTWEDTSTLTS